MKWIVPLLLISLYSFAAEPTKTGCHCPQCSCTEKAHCGCFSEAGCASTPQGNMKCACAKPEEIKK